MKTEITKFSTETVDKRPLPDYTGDGIKFCEGILHRNFDGEFNSRQVLQLIRLQEEGKSSLLSRWKVNYFKVAGFWRVQIRHKWCSGWIVSFITYAEGSSN
ncbi:MAG TPA: hypothetical protein P5232_03215 [Candidatus Moranbacteria bacterium]|nr:hypothetical protein [Candidatus Moranbacteria bacterium]